MQGERLAVESGAGASFETILKNGVRENPWIDGLAAGTDRTITLLLWNYHDDDVPAPDSTVRLVIGNLPPTARRVMIHHYRIDQTHSNAYAEWRRMGSPQQPTAAQQAALESAGQLQMLDSPQWTSTLNGEVRLQFALPRQAVSLVEVSW
jgi:xylan 1,4-beta-xylosidase